LQKFNSAAKLFGPDADLDRYARLVHRLRGLTLIGSTDQMAVLASAILFDYAAEDQFATGSESLRDAVVFSERLYSRFLRQCPACLERGPLLKVLSEMADFYARFAVSGHEDGPLEWGDHYSVAEEQWIFQQLAKVEAALRSVSVGERLFWSTMCTSIGIIPLPESHHSEVFKAMRARMIQVAQIHPELRALTEEGQRRHLEHVVPLGVALSAIKAEHCTNGLEQLTDLFGSSDEVLWKDRYVPWLSSEANLAKIELAGDPSLAPEVAARLRHLAERCKILVFDAELYKLNLLVELTRPLSAGENPGLDLVHAQYLFLLKRRVAWVCHRGSGFCSGDAIVNDILFCHQLLREMSDIVRAQFPH
jgi:hypothetical protein